MISDILVDLAAGSSGITSGSAAVDSGSSFFAGVITQIANFFSAAFGS